MMVDAGPKFYSTILPAHPDGHKVKVKNLKILY